MRVSAKVLRVMHEEHISPDELRVMLDRSAVSRLRGFNRRFHHWLFKLQGPSLIDMQHAQLPEVGEGDARVYEDHEECAGRGCRSCGWSGRIVYLIKDKTLPVYEPLHLHV